MSITQETAKAMVRVEQAEKLLFRLMENAEAVEHELSQARSILRGRKTESVGLPGKQWAERPANADAAVHMVLTDAALSNGETDYD